MFYAYYNLFMQILKAIFNYLQARLFAAVQP